MGGAPVAVPLAPVPVPPASMLPEGLAACGPRRRAALQALVGMPACPSACEPQLDCQAQPKRKAVRVDVG